MIQYEKDNTLGHREWARAIFAEVYAEQNQSTIDTAEPVTDNGPVQNPEDLSFEELERLTAPDEAKEAAK